MNAEEIYAEDHLRIFVEYMDAVRRNWDEITQFKQCYQDGYKDGAEAALADISYDDRVILWRATTKGSVFTTDERAWIKKAPREEPPEGYLDPPPLVD